MTAADFLAKADALKAKGMMALFSSDLGLLKAEVGAASQAWRAQAKPPLACAPARVQLNDQQIYDLVAAVPVAERATTSVRTAMIAGMNRKFPCH